jgi:uncharacterized protein YggE
MRMSSCSGLVLVASLALGCHGQELQINRTNKTIMITAQAEVTAEPEIATLNVGYKNFSPSRDEAYKDNLRISAAILQAMLDAKVPQEDITTDRLSLDYTTQSDEVPKAQQEARRFFAEQSWRVMVPVARAQVVLDAIAKAGANVINAPDFEVKDPDAMQARASGAALAKAHAVAEQMAKGLNAKLGDLVYASNTSELTRIPRMSASATLPVNGRNYLNFSRLSAYASLRQVATDRLSILPEKVRKTAVVYAVFAIE